MKFISDIKTVLISILLILFITEFAFTQSTQPRDGKLLRGEKWQRLVPVKKADFYVSTNGNDNWSGTLSEPNADKTDGPFATIKRAQTAVKVLKSKVYSPKDEPIEKRYIGGTRKEIINGKNCNDTTQCKASGISHKYLRRV